MRAAPPVAVTCRSHGHWDAAVWITRMAAAAVAAAWCALWLAATPWMAVGAALAAGLLVDALRRRSVGSTCTVAWDGERWTWDDRPGKLTAVLDLGGCLLLRFDPAEHRRPRWLAAQAVDGAAQLHGLRAALFGPGARTAAGSR